MTVEYEYLARGKCVDCEDIIWSETLNCGIICKCGNAHIMGNIKNNIATISDEEHILAIRNGYPISEETNIIIIKI